MHNIEPYYNWRHLYTAEDDEMSPFFKREYSEFEFSNTVYNYYIHPQWDDMGSKTLYIKLIFIDYEDSYAIIEMIGEWNDAIDNDIQTLKRNIIDLLVMRKISKFIIIGENVLTFHSDTDDYYEEWYEDVKEAGGWIVGINFSKQNLDDFKKSRITNYVFFFDEDDWRTLKPEHFFQKIDSIVLNA
jgi:hypothetical protein